MTAFIILNETDAIGAPRGSVLVNVDAIIRVSSQGPNHCALLTQPCGKDGSDAAANTSGMGDFRIFVAGTLQDLQIKLNCAAA